jgi:DNA-binding protein Fis
MINSTKSVAVVLNVQDLSTALARAEEAVIEHAYITSKYNQSRAARSLGISRGSLRTKLKTYFGDKYL